MKNALSRRELLASTGTAALAIGLGSTAALAACSHDHKQMAYRLGATLVDPRLDSAAKAYALQSARCPHCDAAIEPEGLSYGEHMRG